MKANKVRIKLNFCTYRTMDNIILLCLNLLRPSLWILSSNKYKVLKKTKLKDFYTWRGKKNFSKLFSSKTPKQCMLNFWRNIACCYWQYLFTIHKWYLKRKKKTIMREGIDLSCLSARGPHKSRWTGERNERGKCIKRNVMAIIWQSKNATDFWRCINCS